MQRESPVFPFLVQANVGRLGLAAKILACFTKASCMTCLVLRTTVSLEPNFNRNTAPYLWLMSRRSLWSDEPPIRWRWPMEEELCYRLKRFGREWQNFGLWLWKFIQLKCYILCFLLLSSAVNFEYSQNNRDIPFFWFEEKRYIKTDNVRSL